ncbi:glycosyltransferase family 39 protein [bacterium]|nr:glycosyltransferase family 39 protein [bacterium]
MDPRPHRRRLVALALLLIVGLGWVRFFSVLLTDRIPPVYDPANLAAISGYLAEAVAGARPGVALTAFLDSIVPWDYPPLIHLTALPFLLSIDHSKAAEFSLAVYLALLLVATFFIARRMAGDMAGLLAAALALFVPHLDAFSRIYMPDLPLAALTACFMAVLFASDGFTRRPAVLGLALCVTAGMLVKQTFVVYVGPPLAVYLMWSWITAAEQRAVVRRHLALFAVAGGVVPLAYYIPILPGFLDYWQAMHTFVIKESGDVQYRIFYYPKLFYQSAAGPILTALAFGGLLAARKSREWACLAVWPAIPLLAIDWYQPELSARYLLPILPAIGVAITAGFARLCENRSRVFAAVSAAGVLASAAAGFGLHLASLPQDAFDFDDFHARLQRRGMPRARTLFWSTEKLADFIIEQNETDRPVVLLINSPYTEALGYRLRERNPYARVDNLIARMGIGAAIAGVSRLADMKLYFANSGIVVLHSMWEEDVQYINYPTWENPRPALEVIRYFKTRRNHFRLVGRFDYPEGLGRLLVYKREPKIVETLSDKNGDGVPDHYEKRINEVLVERKDDDNQDSHWEVWALIDVKGRDYMHLGDHNNDGIVNYWEVRDRGTVVVRSGDRDRDGLPDEKLPGDIPFVGVEIHPTAREIWNLGRPLTRKEAEARWSFPIAERWPDLDEDE